MWSFSLVKYQNFPPRRQQLDQLNDRKDGKDDRKAIMEKRIEMLEERVKGANASPDFRPVASKPISFHIRSISRKRFLSQSSSDEDDDNNTSKYTTQ